MLDENKKWALRRSPTVEQPVQIEPATGRLWALMDDGWLRTWAVDGKRLPYGESPDDLIPLQTAPSAAGAAMKALRFEVQVAPDGRVIGGIIFSLKGCKRVPMIERPPGDALADAVDKWVNVGGAISDLREFLRKYRGATQ